MGSLPNLNELCRERAQRRAMERERDIARERVREREFSRGDKEKGERLPILLQTQIPRHQHHRHSLTARKVHRTRSSGATHHIWDDPMIEHMAAYSPISSRSHRTNLSLPPPPPPYQIQAAAAASRRRESVNSSIGATSIRRLLTVNRGCRHKIPVHIRSKVAKNFTFLVIAHGLTCAVLVPLFGLQASNSTWFHKEKWLNLGPNIGSLLLSICFLVTAGMCLLTMKIVKKCGYMVVIASSYAGLCIFLLAHMYPSIYTLLPAYLLLGVTLGPAWICKWNLVVFFASRISCGQHECNNTSSTIDGTDEHKTFCNRDERVRRLARWFHAAENFGIVIGALLASFVMTCASSDIGCFYGRNVIIPTAKSIPINIVNNNATLDMLNKTITSQSSDASIATTTTLNYASTILIKSSPPIATDKEYTYDVYVEPTISQSDQLIDSMYNINEQGKRICGADLCPVWIYYSEFNYTENISSLGKHTGTMPLIIIYTTLGLIALTLTCLSQQIDNSFKCESIKGMTDTLLFASPMAYFIGTEQGYVLGDFTKAFVSCSLGPEVVAGSLVGMGLMQLVVGCTLSMLLRHTKRYAVLAAGFFFHACLLLVLSRWKPSSDDSALFYAIAAAWGACNAMWETLMFTIITLTHPSHVIEVASPIQSLRFLGLGITFAAHGFLCETPKILVLVILLVITVLPYAMLEVRLESQRKNQMTNL